MGGTNPLLIKGSDPNMTFGWAMRLSNRMDNQDQSRVDAYHPVGKAGVLLICNQYGIRIPAKVVRNRWWPQWPDQ
jgi:hypothetical protein